MDFPRMAVKGQPQRHIVQVINPGTPTKSNYAATIPWIYCALFTYALEDVVVPRMEQPAIISLNHMRINDGSDLW